MAAKSPVSILMELYGTEVDYNVQRSGPDHAPLFVTSAVLKGKTASGVDGNKKASRQKAAQALLDLLSDSSPADSSMGNRLHDVPVEDSLPRATEPSVLSLIQPTVGNAISLLKEFEDRNIKIKIDYDPNFRPKDANYSLFYVRCTLSGHLNGEPIEPLVGVGSGSRKKIAKINAAGVVAQMLIDKRLIIQPIRGNIIDTSNAQQDPCPLDDLRSLTHSLKEIEISSKVEDNEDLKLVNEVQGCYEKLCEQLEGTGKKVFVDTLSKGSLDDQSNVKACILSIRADGKSNLEFDPDEQCWHGHHLNADIAKDIAAHRALKQLDQKMFSYLKNLRLKHGDNPV